MEVIGALILVALGWAVLSLPALIFAGSKISKLRLEMVKLREQLQTTVEDVARLQKSKVKRSAAQAENFISEQPTQLYSEPIAETPQADERFSETYVENNNSELEINAIAATTEMASEFEPAKRYSSPGIDLKAKNVEHALASRWFVWIGGAAVALAGLLLIKYAHDHGLISPTLRVLLGLLLAATLVVAGEYVRRSRSADVVDYVPAALSAAGLVTGFGSVYAAHALYGLIPGGVAFVGLGAVAFGAFALSWLQGPLIAALGLIGAYAAPVLVTSDNPNPWAFYPYLFVIVAASFFTLRGRNWWWLGYLGIAGALLWSLLWIHGAAFALSDIIPIGLFALALGAATTLLLEGRNIFKVESGSLADPMKLSNPLRLAACGMVAASTILVVQVFASEHSFTALVLFAMGMALLASFSWAKQGMSGAALMAAMLTFYVLMGWREGPQQRWFYDEINGWSLNPDAIALPLFLKWMFLALAAFASLGALGYWRKADSRAWAILAAGSAVLFLFGAWARADFVMEQGAWAIIAAFLTAALFTLAYLRRNKNTEPTQEFSSTALVIGATLLALFALDRTFDNIWFTISIAALAAAVAWSSRIMTLFILGPIASILGTIAAIRLFAAREFWIEPTDLPLGAHWPLYGYGVTAALLWWASRVLAPDTNQKHRVALEGLSLGLAISLVSLELRVLIGGGVVGHPASLLEMSAHILAWLGAAYGLAYRQQIFTSFVSLWGSRILLAGSCATIVGLSLLSLNPMVTANPIEGNALINTLWLAYLGPIILLILLSRKIDSLNLGNWKSAVGALALLLLLTFVTLETKRLFQGPVIAFEFASDTEAFTVTFEWLLLACGLAYWPRFYSQEVSQWGARSVLALACAALALVNLGSHNPVVTGHPVLGFALFNTLWLAYLAPIAVLAMIAQKKEILKLGRWHNAPGVLILVSLVAFVTLETKRIFQGPYLIPQFVNDAESYALSAVWLITAVVLFIAGLKWNRPDIRYAGLAVMILALLKTFAYDLWQLGGLWQIASVMGIGLSLIGIGWLYTRFVKEKPV